MNAEILLMILVLWYVTLRQGVSGLWCFEGHLLCLYTTALFPVLTAVRELLDSQDERTAGL